MRIKLFDRFFRRGSVTDQADSAAVRAYPDELFGDLGALTEAGVRVTEATAMRVSAVYACVQLVAGVVSTLPFHFFQRLPNGDRERVSHDYWWLFNESASNEYTAASWWEYVLMSKLLHGIGYSAIRRRGATVTALEPWHPLRVQAKRHKNYRTYTYWRADGTIEVLHEDDVIVFPGLAYDGLTALSPIRDAAGRSAVGLALAANRYSERAFGYGNQSDLLVTTAGKLTPAQEEELRNSIARRFGGLGESHLPLVLGGDAKVNRLHISPVDLQLLDARKYSVPDIARIFGVPPTLIGDSEGVSSWGSGIESLKQGFVTFTLARHLQSAKQEINRKLFAVRRDIYAEHSLEGLLVGDSKSQSEYLAKALGGPGAQGWMTVNEVRRLKNLPAIPGGDELIFAGGVSDQQQNANQAA